MSLFSLLFFPCQVTFYGYFRITVLALCFLLYPFRSADLLSIDKLPCLVEDPPGSKLSTVLVQETCAREFNAFTAMFDVLLLGARICLTFAP